MREMNDNELTEKLVRINELITRALMEVTNRLGGNPYHTSTALMAAQNIVNSLIRGDDEMKVSQVELDNLIRKATPENTPSIGSKMSDAITKAQEQYAFYEKELWREIQGLVYAGTDNTIEHSMLAIKSHIVTLQRAREYLIKLQIIDASVKTSVAYKCSFDSALSLIERLVDGVNSNPEGE